MSAICKAMPNPERVFFWASSGNEVPDGMRLGWSCAVPYCGKYEHMHLAENLNSNRASWGGFAQKLLSLPLGGFTDIEDAPSDDSFLNKLRCAMYMRADTRSIKFLVHKLPWGGVRMIRVGTSPTYWNRFSKEDCGREFHPPSRHKVETYQRPPVLWLGLLWNSSLKASSVKKSVCSVRACPLPAGIDGMCYSHRHFFDYPLSMTDNKIDMSRVFSDAEPDREYDLFPEFLTRTASLEKSLRVVRNGYDRNEHKNQGNDQDLLGAPIDEDRARENARRRHTAAMRKAQVRPKDLEVMADEFLLEAARRATTSKERNEIKQFVRVIAEPRIDYAPEQSVVNYQGRGTRGGHPGGHKKIRKSQRKRPAGWHGSRPKHDVFKRWSRETIEGSEYNFDDFPDLTPATPEPASADEMDGARKD